MHGRREIASLWPEWIRLYFWAMARKVLNIPLSYDLKRFWAFLDGYATGLDIYPACGTPPLHQSPKALWQDFVRVASDANSAFYRNVKKPE